MKNTLLLLLAAFMVAGLMGCCAHHGKVHGACASGPACGPACGPVGCGHKKLLDRPCGPGACGVGACGPAGCGISGATPVAAPPFGAVSYPYYTIHGPRDFLNPAPRPIGP